MIIKLNLIRILLAIVTILRAGAIVAQPITKVAGGWEHSLFLKSDGSLWGMGDNSAGQLGDGTTNSVNVPEQIMGSNVTAIAAGLGWSLFVKTDGSLWAMGFNGDGQLGDGTYNQTNRPEEIMTNGAVAVAAGEFHSLVLKNDGSLWAMGYDGNGQLGDGTESDNIGVNQPEEIVASNVTAIAAGGFHSLFLKSDGSLWGMGYNGTGELGDGTYNDSPLPLEIVASNVTAIAAGDNHSLFLKKGGSLWAMGGNGSGQIGDGTYGIPPYLATNIPEQIVASNVTAIAAGFESSLFIKSDSSLWGMGDNSYGQLGDDGNEISTNLPEKIVASSVSGVATKYFWSAFFLKNDESLWAMGKNDSGQLGDGTTNKINTPTQIVAGPPGYNQLSIQLLNGGNVALFYVGMAGANYELDRSFSLSSVGWVPQATNLASSDGTLVFTNMPNSTTNNFWRIRSFP